MMEEINNPVEAGTDEPQLDGAETDFDTALDGLFDDPDTDNIEPQDGDQDVEANASDDEAQSDNEDEPQEPQDANDADPVKYILPDGTEATAEEIMEWKGGHLMQSDYTRKMQGLSDNRREVLRIKEEYQQQVQRVEQELDLAIAVAQNYMPPPPDGRLLNTGNPNDAIEFQRQQYMYEQRASELQQLVRAREGYQQQSTQAEQQKQVELIQREQQALYEAHPELRDPAARQAFRQQASDTIQHYGFTQQELDSVYDHRLIGMLKDLSEYRKLKAAKPAVQKKAENAPPVRQPGKRVSSSDQKRQSIADRIEKLRSTGAEEDFEALLDDYI